MVKDGRAYVNMYIDFDSCYYNLARIIYHVAPWTIVTNKFNHIISVPHWLENHFGVKKITYLAPPGMVKLKAKCFIRVFNIDKVPNGRSVMTDFLNGMLDKVKMVAPDAYIISKDSIAAEVKHSEVDTIRTSISLPCTIGVGFSTEEAKNDCKEKKLVKKNRLSNTAAFVLLAVPMVIAYMVNLIRRTKNENYEDFGHAYRDVV